MLENKHDVTTFLITQAFLACQTFVAMAQNTPPHPVHSVIIGLVIAKINGVKASNA